MKNIVIKSDLFDISNRIKSIDKKYYIVFNLQNGKYEVHYKRTKNTYELTLPFTELDARTIEYVQKTKIENQKKLIAEMENQNALLEAENVKKILKKAGEVYDS